MSVASEARTRLEKQVCKRILAIDDVLEGECIFGDGVRTWAFFVDATQMANLFGDDVLSLRLTKPEIAARRAALKSDDRVQLKSSSDWIRVAFASATDVDFVIELATAAAAAHRPATGIPSRPPPTGADLARRQRFH